jgi:hypothetical protein
MQPIKFDTRASRVPFFQWYLIDHLITKALNVFIRRILNSHLFWLNSRPFFVKKGCEFNQKRCEFKIFLLLLVFGYNKFNTGVSKFSKFKFLTAELGIEN